MKFKSIIIFLFFIQPIFLNAQSIEITPSSSVKKEGSNSILEGTGNNILRLTRVADNYFEPATIQFANRISSSPVNNVFTHAYVSSSQDGFSIRHIYGFAKMEFGLATGTKFIIKTDTVFTRVNAQIDGYTKLGSDAPSIKMKKLTGTTASAQGGNVAISHDLDDSKILSINVMVDYSSDDFIPASYKANPGYEFDWYSENGKIYVWNKAGNSVSILSKPFKVLITYEE